jgi:signal transduction histidine kinase
MDMRSSLSNRFRQLRWKLTLSYTAVTVAALLAVELVLYGLWVGGLAVLINSGFLPAQLTESLASEYVWELRPYLAESPPDQDGIAEWLERIRPAPGSVGFNIDEADGLFVIGGDGQLLGVSPSDYLEPGVIGQPLDPQVIPGLANPLQAALAGKEDTEDLYTIVRPDNQFVMAVPVWDAAHEQVLGVLVASVAIPTVMAHLRELVRILGASLLLFTLVAGLIGTAFGFLAARRLVHRLDRLAEATLAWSQGEFTVFVDDPTGDELGQLAQRLNHMAQQLQRLLDTRRELVVLEERNRLARDLHDSVTQALYGVTLYSEAAGGQLSLGNVDRAAEHLRVLRNTAQEALAEMRLLIYELRPPVLEQEGLVAALQARLMAVEGRVGLQARLRVEGEGRLPAETEEGLYRIAQEALNNALKHAHAHNITVCLRCASQGGNVSLEVIDDGQGFDVVTARGKGGLGLSAMEERATELGGRLSIVSKLGEGTRVLVEVYK